METETTRVCAHCAGPIPKRARVDAEVCSGRCRVARMRARRKASPLPVELRSRPRWVRRSSTKVPLTVGGGAASSTDPSTWSTYTEAAASRVGAGVGFVLNGDDVVCIDLDHCVTDGVVEPWAQALVDKAGPTYVELSPSGTGLHIWGRAHGVRGGVVAVPGGKAEVYGWGRYIAIGTPFGKPAQTLVDVSGLVSELLGACA